MALAGLCKLVRNVKINIQSILSLDKVIINIKWFGKERHSGTRSRHTERDELTRSVFRRRRDTLKRLRPGSQRLRTRFKMSLIHVVGLFVLRVSCLVVILLFAVFIGVVFQLMQVS